VEQAQRWAAWRPRGVVAALTPLVAMVFKERNEVLTVVTVGDAAFYGVGFAIMLTVAWLTRRG
jgi:hypothetical protein